MLTLAGAGVLIFAVVFVALVAVQAGTVLQVYRGAATRRPRDVSHERREMPAPAAALAAGLQALGFERLGEVELTVPSTSGLGAYFGRQERHTTWVLLDSQDTTVAEVVAIGPLAALSSTLPDGSVVETMFPRGERIDDRDFWSDHVTTNLVDAYDAHRVAIDRRVESRGQPREVHNMRDYMRLDADYRQRFAQRVLRRPLMRNVLIPTGIMVGIVALGTLLLFASGWLS